jgi:NAD(P)-dependent dehydrogenase (short-subunit alcohol dehydrogenase family)
MAGRTCVVTGAASGIGAATAELLRSRGDRVIGVDLAGTEVAADLSTSSGRASMIDAVTELAGGTLDAVIANAGTSTGGPLDVRVNYFGAVATLVGLRSLLLRSDAPRAVATASSSIHLQVDDALVEACLAGDEEGAASAAERAGLGTYPATKRALARWVRRAAPTADWAGVGIGLNAVAPGIIRTPMTGGQLEDPGMRELFDAAVPMPYGGYGEPESVARLIAFLVDAETTMITGQVVFVDGGADAVNRGDDIWP